MKKEIDFFLFWPAQSEVPINYDSCELVCTFSIWSISFFSLLVVALVLFLYNLYIGKNSVSNILVILYELFLRLLFLYFAVIILVKFISSFIIKTSKIFNLKFFLHFLRFFISFTFWKYFDNFRYYFWFSSDRNILVCLILMQTLIIFSFNFFFCYI